MPKETDRLKLPLPLGNENVTRESINGIFEKIDAGVATQADLDALREAVSQMDIPDASLTQKGKVQLSSKTDGTSETVAATEKAVWDAKNACLLRTGGVMTGRLIMNQWGTFSGSSNGSVLYGSNCFLEGSTFRYENNHTNLGARGIYMRYTGGAGPEVYMFETGPVATTAGGAFTPSLTRIVNTADSWQKHQLTDDNGKNKLTSGIDLNSLMVNGQYNGNNLTNAPLPATADMWWYIEVQCHTNGEGYVLQRASRLNGGTPTLYLRTRENGVWSPWSLDVFQSGVDAKNSIVGAINAKGGSASTSDTWTQLTAKINAIQQGHYQSMDLPSRSEYFEVPGGYVGSLGNAVLAFPAGTRVISLIAPVYGSAFLNVYNSYGGLKTAFALRDSQGVIWPITIPVGTIGAAGGIDFRVYSVQVDIVSGLCRSNGYSVSQNSNSYWSTTKPSNFNADGPMTLVCACIENTTVTRQVSFTTYNTRALSM
ncbi:tail fiber protein [Paenibacillus sp. FSL R5-0766]|uniref:tail fiber protein n=1 Tax=unclassified Paenibacillus TaxID=185978 RepID=UPI00096D8B8F|nr:tail fiber protein [Paenibacillus sp. FSL R5-0765]OMF66297.1 hypothetical protein BK141_05055 [Paenibacillus sp. FSL R5-0765]